jgi:hypothetical protein
MLEEVEQLVGLAAARAEMDVRDEKRAVSFRGVVRHVPRLTIDLFMCETV